MSKLPVKKIYIDSRHKTADSISDANFKIALPYTITMQHDAVFFITDICVPYLWRTVDLNAQECQRHLFLSLFLFTIILV